MDLEIDFDNLTIDQMNTLEAELKKHRESRKKQHLIAAREEFQKIADSYGFGVEEIALIKIGKAAKKSSTSVAPKYRDLQSAQTWTGRGRKPLWVEAALNSGVSLEEMLIG